MNLTLRRIRDFISKCDGDTYISFSGGKDSTVLLDLVRQVDPSIVAVFADTGLEFPEIRDFVKASSNVVWVKPDMNFKKVIEVHGYPIVTKMQAKYIREVQSGTTEYTESKRRGGVIGRNGRPLGAVSTKWQYLMDQQEVKISDKCCDVMKKKPFRKFEREYKKKNGDTIYAFVGVMAEESTARLQSWTEYGCNAFDMKIPQGRPLMFWDETDIWEYIRSRNLPYSKIYDMGYKRTGCVFCAFGAHLEKGENRFQLLQQTHPKLHKYCMASMGDYGLGMSKALHLIGVNPYHNYEQFLEDCKNDK